MKLFLDFSFIIGVVTTLLITIVLLRSSKEDRSKRILAVVFGLFFIVLLCFYGYLHQIEFLFYIGFIFEDSINISAGPLIYIYIKSIFDNRKGLIRKNLIHFIPVLFYVIIISIPAFISIINHNVIFSYLDDLGDYISLDIVYSLVYMFLSLKLLNSTERGIKENYSNLDDKDLSWVKKMLLGLIIIILIDLSSTLYELLFQKMEWQTGYITIFSLVILIAYLGYHGVSQSQILLPQFILNREPNVSTRQKDDFIENKTKQVTHHLANSESSEIEELKLKLIEILETDKAYLDENITLGGLAELIETSDKKLSALLNHFMETNFYDLINSYRVEEFKSKLINGKDEHLTLLALAYESGFKSKTSFNRVFKQSTGLSPTQYKKSIS